MTTVLVVDDEWDIRELLAEIIRHMDIYVIEAGDGPTALEQATKDLPDLILLGVLTPKMDGFEVQTKLKENPATRNIPVVLLTDMPTFEVKKTRGLGAEPFTISSTLR